MPTLRMPYWGTRGSVGGAAAGATLGPGVARTDGMGPVEDPEDEDDVDEEAEEARGGADGPAWGVEGEDGGTVCGVDEAGAQGRLDTCATEREAGIGELGVVRRIASARAVPAAVSPIRVDGVMRGTVKGCGLTGSSFFTSGDTGSFFGGGEAQNGEGAAVGRRHELGGTRAFGGRRRGLVDGQRNHGLDGNGGRRAARRWAGLQNGVGDKTEIDQLERGASAAVVTPAHCAPPRESFFIGAEGALLRVAPPVALVTHYPTGIFGPGWNGGWQGGIYAKSGMERGKGKGRRGGWGDKTRYKVEETRQLALLRKVDSGDPSVKESLQRGKRLAALFTSVSMPAWHSRVQMSYDISCQYAMSKTDGETVERKWSRFCRDNSRASVQMPAGKRQRLDEVADALNGWNERKHARQT
ncbi:hypothetical protein C8R43DRAFT_947987 [Mycena crocata]|nr:hypothetical protein C8R43DRAFT_947987 [Mycena crocata]